MAFKLFDVLKRNEIENLLKTPNSINHNLQGNNYLIECKQFDKSLKYFILRKDESMGEWNIRDAKNTIYLDELNNLAWLEQSELIEIYGVEETQKTKDPR